MKKLLLTTTALVAFAAVGAAAAADLPVKAPPMPVVAAPIYNWTGFYIGGSLGGAWEKIDGNFVFPPPATWSVENSRGLWDAHVGAQYQFGSVVLGVEGNFIGLFNNNGSTDTCHPATACPVGSFLSARVVDDIWTIGGRGGWAVGAWMPYISGGYASTRVDNMPFLAGGIPVESTRTRHSGAYIGGGVDWQIWKTASGALVAGIEYRHYEFQSVTAVPSLIPSGLPNTNDTWTIKPHVDTVEARLSWLFNWGGPVVARY
jgi:outer membrane immunogenic protein